MKARAAEVIVLALGQQAAGDDGVGLAVLDELERRGIPRSIRLVRLRDATELVPLLEGDAPVVIVDALVASPAGRIVELGVDDISRRSHYPSSSHGFGVAQAFELAQALAPSTRAPRLRIVGITIDRPDRYRVGLSTVIQAAVPTAADRVLALAKSR